MSAVTFAHWFWFFFSIWQIQLTLFGMGVITGVVLPLKSKSWAQAALLFILWGILFESAIAIGAGFTPYGGTNSYPIHLAYIVYRVTFAAGMVGGLFVSDRRWHRQGG